MKMIKRLFICSETDELKYLLEQLDSKGYVWQKGYKAKEHDIFNALFFGRDFLTIHGEKAVQIYVYADDTLDFKLCSANSILFYKPDDYTGYQIYPERIRIKTISGSVQYVDYLNMLAEQYGYKNYKALRNDGLQIAI